MLPILGYNAYQLVSKVLNPPKVSVIMPVYNTAPYLRTALDSVLGQTFPSWECIAVDDGSTDGSAEVLAEYAAKDKRVKIITQSNSGPVVARTRAVEAAQGEYLLFLDSDDHLNPVLLETVTKVADLEHADMVWFEVVIEDDGRFLHVHREPFTTLPAKMLTYLLNSQIEGWLWTKIVRRDYWQRIRCRVIPECWIMEDTLISLQLLAGNPRIIKAPILGYYYNRGNVKSLTGSARAHDIIGRSIPNLRLIGVILREKNLFDIYRAAYAKMVVPAKVYLSRVGRTVEAQRLEPWVNCRPSNFAQLGRKKWPYWLLMNIGPFARIFRR